MSHETLDQREWLEADGRGGFASGTVGGIRTRRYHGLLLTATTPPTGRMMLVNGLEVWATTPAGRVALSSHLYAPGVRHPDGATRLRSFTIDPWPTWTWDLGDGRLVVGEVLVTHEAPRTVCRWTLAGPGPVTLEIRPLLSGRDYHALHHANGAARLSTVERGAQLEWQLYDGVPAVRCVTTGTFHPEPEWFKQFLYAEERARGLDDMEDLASPGAIHCALDDGPAICVLTAAAGDAPPPDDATAVHRLAQSWMAAERRRRKALGAPLARAADAYLVGRGQGRTIVAGYPWFTDWGRDTSIAVRGLCLAQDRFADARDVLLEWASAVDQGMLPNRFPDQGSAPEYNAVDASLWFVIAAGELLEATADMPRLLPKSNRVHLQTAMAAILSGYSAGTRYGIRMDADGLLAAGEPGQQLTWMDARVDGREITPRSGKPVEVQALWLNALHAGGAFDAQWMAAAERGRQCFEQRFWNPARELLFDVVDVDHRAGVTDATFRPNQIFAVGGLPWPLLSGPRAAAVVAAVERELWTPMGLRSLAPSEPGYVGRYVGSSAERDGAYHQGTVWPWLMGAFVDGWLRQRGYSAGARAEATRRFLAPLRVHLDQAGIGHVSEIADGDAPFTPRGCPCQAWSLGELMRIERMVLPTVPPQTEG